MYSVPAFGKMISDRERTDAYVRAMRQVIKPGSVVVDLGCGPALFALIACQLGARRVFAIEPNNAIQIGRDAAREYGFSDRIEFIQDLSMNINLPERADVIVSDLRGVLPLFGHHLESIADARTRFLAPGGVLIPVRDLLWATVVEVPEQYEEIVGPWQRNGLKLNSARNLTVNSWRKTRARKEEMLTEPICWYELDYSHIEKSNVSSELVLTAARRGTGHGIIVWFDAETIDGIGFSNVPGAEERIYGQAFFPLKEPIDLDRGDRVEVSLDARVIGEDYVWRWNTTVPSKQINFRQSSLFAAPLSPSQLRRRANTYQPKASDDGAIARFVLSQMDGANSIEVIATKLAKEFPLRFREFNEAFDVVAEISDKYSV